LLIFHKRAATTLSPQKDTQNNIDNTIPYYTALERMKRK